MTILLVEDDIMLNDAIKLKLNQNGCEIISVLNAEKAVEVMKEQGDRIDLIWLDLLLPGMNGIEFLEWLRSSRFKDKKVVVVSVSASPDKKERVQQLGVDTYIVKSEFKLDEIIKMVIGNNIDEKPSAAK